MTIQTAPLPPAPERKSRGWISILVWILGVSAALLLVAIVAFVVWATWIPSPLPEAMAALESDSSVTVAVADPITFVPMALPPTCGFIFYPGGRVDYRAYAPALRSIAEAGYFAAILHTLLNLAVLAPSKAAEVIVAHPHIQRWVVGGRSLGDAIEASFLFNHPRQGKGLSLWASFPAGANSLADRSDLAISSISGSLDGLAIPADIEVSRPLLPQQSEFVEIEGGNPTQFGWYGPQSGDKPATITREQQQEQTIRATLRTLAAACAP